MEDELRPPEAKVRIISTPTSSSCDDATSICPICLEPWGNSGDHRLVSLKCGHLFGARCIERWLRAKRFCPTCKALSTVQDLRPIYAVKLVATDTAQIITLKKQIERLQEEMKNLGQELQSSKIAYALSQKLTENQQAKIALMREQIVSLQAEKSKAELELQLSRVEQRKSHTPKKQVDGKSWRFALEKTLEMHKGGCRVLTYNCGTRELYVSQNCLRYGYGISKVSCVDYSLGQFVHLHSKPIMDITYAQPRDLLLSVGLDGYARVVERGIPTAAVRSEAPLWSCSWDYLRSNEFYVGADGGVILQYDVRNTSTCLLRTQAPGDMSPVVSLRSTEYGLLSCQLHSCLLWVVNGRRWAPRAMPIEGPFMSLSYDRESNRVLLSCKPKTTGERCKLAVIKLTSSGPRSITDTEHPGRLEVVIDVERTLPGSSRCSVESRAAWVKAPGASWLAGYSESDSALCLHGLDGARNTCLPARAPVIDLCSIQLNGDSLLAALSDSTLSLYKAVVHDVTRTFESFFDLK